MHKFSRGTKVMHQGAQSYSRYNSASQEVLTRLSRICADRNLTDLEVNLKELRSFVFDDLETFEKAIADVWQPHNLVGLGVNHILQQPGKRLRPLCVLLASRIGTWRSPVALDLAVAVELVHNATLLHDDVVDLAETRRAVSTTREKYGNAVSIFAGDWLLMEAFFRVSRAGVPGVLDFLVKTLQEMILAESMQLEKRGQIDTSRLHYFRVAEGKTAALFRWAIYSGARAGSLPTLQCAALDHFALNLGIAFQMIDDMLDLTGDALETGKALFSDLIEGNMTYPLILAVERDPSLKSLLEEIIVQARIEPECVPLCEQAVSRIVETGALRECGEHAHQRVTHALNRLSVLPENPAKRALATVAEAVLAAGDIHGRVRQDGELAFATG